MPASNGSPPTAPLPTRCYWLVLDQHLNFKFLDPFLTLHMGLEASSILTHNLLEFVFEPTDALKRDLLNAGTFGVETRKFTLSSSLSAFVLSCKEVLWTELEMISPNHNNWWE